MDDLRRWHKQQGWSDIGYHYVIYRNGDVVCGRDVDIIGAHCAAGGHNQHSIGICYIGGVENKKGVPMAKQKAKDTRTEQQKLSLLSLLMDLRKLYPSSHIFGHHDFEKKKDCPSFDAMNEYKKL